MFDNKVKEYIGKSTDSEINVYKEKSASDKKTLAIIEALIKLAQIVDLKVTCEGIETKEQLNLLKNLVCDNLQGYFFSKPVAKENILNYIKEFNKLIHI